MPRQATGYSEDLARIADTILGDLSQEGASRKCNGEVSGPTFGRFRSGKVVSKDTLVRIADALWDRICKHYGDEVKARYGLCAPDTATAWLLTQAGYGNLPVSEADLGPAGTGGIIDITAYRGAEDLPASDLRTLHALVETFVLTRRRELGLD